MKHPQENISQNYQKNRLNGSESLPRNNSSIKKNLLFEPLSKSKSINSKEEYSKLQSRSNNISNNSELITRSTFDQRNSRVYPFLKRKDILLNKFPQLKEQLIHETKEELHIKLNSNIRLLFWIDLISALADIVIISWAYYDHYDYIDSNYVISDSSNSKRFVFMIISLFICIALISRQFKNISFQNLNYLLGRRDTGKLI